MKVLFILVDALKSLYLDRENMPFLFELSRSNYYVRKIHASPGFCERSEVFTGLTAYESGNFCALAYAPENSEYRNRKIILMIASMLSHVGEKYSRYFMSRWYENTNVSMKPYQIPLDSLKMFALTEDASNHYIQYSDIFESLHSADKSFTNEFFTTLAQKKRRNCENLVADVKKAILKQIDFIPVYIGEIDSIGHKYGGCISKIRPYLIKIDKLLAELHSIAEKSGYGVVILGDHGMVPVSERVDVSSIFNNSRLCRYKDYELFLDSTMARFWFYSEAAEKEGVSAIQNKLNGFGMLLDSKSYYANELPLDIKNTFDGKPIYGDYLWCANSGVLITPDYFNPPQKPISGMHGYLMNDSEHSFGQMVVSGYKEKCVIEEMRLTSVCDVLCEMLEIEKPNSKKWRE